MTTIETKDLGEQITAIGKLIGLLSDAGGNGDTVTVNTDWFENPITGLETANTRLDELVTLISSILTQNKAGPSLVLHPDKSDESTEAQWYNIPNPVNGAVTSFHIVTLKDASRPTNAAGEIGLGLLDVLDSPVPVVAYAYVPIFQFGTEPATLIAGNQVDPCLLGVEAKGAFGVDTADGEYAFTGFRLQGAIYLAAIDPSVEIAFEQLQKNGVNVNGTYTSLYSLRQDPDIPSLIGAVLTGSSAWLNQCISGTPYTVGEILEAAGFVRRVYEIQPEDLNDMAGFAAALCAGADPVSTFLWGQFTDAQKSVIGNPHAPDDQLQQQLTDALNHVVSGPSIYDQDRFKNVNTSPQTEALLRQAPVSGEELQHLNRSLLEDSYQNEHYIGANTNPYTLSLEKLQGNGLEIAQNLLFAALDALAMMDLPLIPLPDGGIYVAAKPPTGDPPRDYGLRIAANFPLGGGSSSNDGQPASPEVDLCLGAWFSGENGTNWYSTITGENSESGLAFYGLHRAADKKLSFSPSFEFTSIGINIKGGGNSPLIDLNGYSLGGVELRFYLDSATWNYGFAARLDQVGFPVAPDFNATQNGGSGDAVAKNLLASGSSDQSADPKKVSATNPAFSAEAGYVKGHDPMLQLYDPSGKVTDLIWFPIQRRFGPVDVNRIGLRVDVTGKYANDPLLGMAFDGGVTLSALSVELDQLEIDMLLKHITEISGYSLSLQGMQITFNGGGVEISGGFTKNTKTDPVSYDGEAIIKLESFGISAVGSYSSLPGGGTSLFIFALVNDPIGGPGFFYITGLSAGFGYNRALKLPAQNEIQNFPLVAGLSNTASMGGANPALTDLLQKLEPWIPAQRGEYWLAAGVQFTTYDIINTNALLVVQFGDDFSIALIGTSVLKHLSDGETFVYAELDLEAIFEPLKGEFKASATLASSSYVLTQQAHLTGGFAFYAWFGSNEHAGDFVFTMGGYHPAFKRPDYYPQVDRLGINWKVDDSISLVGGSYFAITPTAMMAGMSLALTFEQGPLKAWLKATADAILYYKPFYLDVNITISVGVSYRIQFLGIDKTLSVEIGASVDLFGPPFGGSVHVDWYIISFTINFGAAPNPPQTLDWEGFKGMLPNKTTTDAANTSSKIATMGAAPVQEPSTKKTQVYLHIDSNQGLLRTQSAEGFTFWLVRAGDFTFTAASAIPATSVIVHGRPDDSTFTGNPVGIQRLNGGIKPSHYQSTQDITVLNVTDANVTDLDGFVQVVTQKGAGPGLMQIVVSPQEMINPQDWALSPVTQKFPQALYGDPANSENGLNSNPDSPTVTATVGVVMQPKPSIVSDCTPQMVIDRVFEDRITNADSVDDEKRMPLSQSAAAVDVSPRLANSFLDIAKIDADISTQRKAVFNALQSLGLNGWANDLLSKMAATPGQAFADEPLEGSPVPVS